MLWVNAQRRPVQTHHYRVQSTQGCAPSVKPLVGIGQTRPLSIAAGSGSCASLRGHIERRSKPHWHTMQSQDDCAVIHHNQRAQPSHPHWVPCSLSTRWRVLPLLEVPLQCAMQLCLTLCPILELAPTPHGRFENLFRLDTYIYTHTCECATCARVATRASLHTSVARIHVSSRSSSSLGDTRARSNARAHIDTRILPDAHIRSFGRATASRNHESVRTNAHVCARYHARTCRLQ